MTSPAAVWCPWATRDVIFPDAGAYVAGPYRLVLHTTEGASYAGARAAYAASHNGPHFTVDASGVHQHLPIDRAATALVHAPGTIDTNRLSAVQIEVVGFAAQPGWPLPLIAQVRTLVLWLEQQVGIQAVAPQFHGGGTAGVAPYRMTADQWRTFNGVCGHQHVPGNDHWDPGAIDIAPLILPVQGAPVPDATPPVYKVNAVPVSISITPSGNGYIILTADGGVFAFGDAKYLGRVTL